MNPDWELAQSDQLLPNARVNSAGTKMVVPRNEWGSIPDISMAGGICFALSTEWCISCLKNENFSQGSVFNRMLSRQRAYNMTFEHLIKNLTKEVRYTQYFLTAESPSFRFMQDQVRHMKVECVRKAVKPNQISINLRGLFMQQQPCILGFFGVEDGENWGHATAVSGLGGKNPRFYDPNQGQFSWSSSTGANTISREILSNIDDLYELHTIRDYVIYTLG